MLSSRCPLGKRPAKAFFIRLPLARRALGRAAAGVLLIVGFAQHPCGGLLGQLLLGVPAKGSLDGVNLGLAGLNPGQGRSAQLIDVGRDRGPWPGSLHSLGGGQEMIGCRVCPERHHRRTQLVGQLREMLLAASGCAGRILGLCCR